MEGNQLPEVDIQYLIHIHWLEVDTQVEVDNLAVEDSQSPGTVESEWDRASSEVAWVWHKREAVH